MRLTQPPTWGSAEPHYTIQFYNSVHSEHSNVRKKKGTCAVRNKSINEAVELAQKYHSFMQYKCDERIKQYQQTAKRSKETVQNDLQEQNVSIGEAIALLTKVKEKGENIRSTLLEDQEVLHHVFDTEEPSA
jgi:NADH:ubiquinone oxidoreductase subunit